MTEFPIEPAGRLNGNSIKTLLKVCELPNDDISPAHLRHFFIVLREGELVGAIGLEPCNSFGLLRSLAVRKAYRDQGLGHKLVARIEAYARQNSIQALYLLTTTANDFFSKLGYQSVDRASAPSEVQATVEFQSICPASAVCMWKRI